MTDNYFEVVPGTGRIFAVGPDRDWLIELCAPRPIEVLPGSA